MKPVGFIYITENKINGMKYIGKCIYNRQNNWRTYLGSGEYLKKAIKKYGKENFTRTIIDKAFSLEELNQLEEFYIKMFNAVESEQFYNLKFTAIGGDVFTTNPRKEEIRKMRILQMSGKGNHQYGKPKTKKMIDSVKKANARPILIDGIKYKSITEASDILNIGLTTIAYRLDSDKFENYIRLLPKNSPDRYRPHTKTKQIEVDGKVYNGYKEATKALGISKGTLYNRLKNPKYPNYKRLN